MEDPEKCPESYKIFDFREYTLKMKENDVPGQWLQSALKNKNQTNFLRNLWLFQFQYSTSAKI
jgi:hypothetical protein